MFCGMDIKQYGSEERRDVNDWLSTRGNLAMWVVLAVLAVVFVWFLVAGLVR